MGSNLCPASRRKRLQEVPSERFTLPKRPYFDALLRLFRQSLKGILGSWSTLRTGSTTTRSGSGLTNNRGAIRLGYPDGSLALGVLGAECPKRFARLVELVGLLDVDLERPGLEQSCETL